MEIYTLGYQGWKPAQIVEILDARGARLVDIRYRPTSRAPQWRQAALTALCGDRYVWIQALGNRAYKEQPRHIEIADLDTGLARLAALVAAVPNVVLMCGCPTLGECHRLQVAQAIEAHWKTPVEHLDRPINVTRKVLRNSAVQLTLPVTIPPGKPRGRPRVHASNAAKQANHRRMLKVTEIQRKRQGDYSTPQDLFERYDRVYHFTLDVCATDDNAKCPHYFTPEQDGLQHPWHGTCWMNPPYHQAEIPKWIRKAYDEAQRGAVVVALLPARTGSQWFHELVLPHAAVTFLRGRVKFAGLTTNAREDSMIAVFGAPCAQALVQGHCLGCAQTQHCPPGGGQACTFAPLPA